MKLRPRRSKSRKTSLERHIAIRKTDGILQLSLAGDALGHISLQASKDITVAEIYSLVNDTLLDIFKTPVAEARYIQDLPRSRSSESWKAVLGIKPDTPTLSVPFPLRCLVTLCEDKHDPAYDAFKTPSPARAKKPDAPRKKQQLVAPVATRPYARMNLFSSNLFEAVRPTTAAEPIWPHVTNFQPPQLSADGFI